jgi:hypothetical protein
MRTTFDMSPSELRALRSGRKMTAGQGGITLYLTYRPPFDWRTLVRFLKAAAVHVQVRNEDIVKNSGLSDECESSPVGRLSMSSTRSAGSR